MDRSWTLSPINISSSTPAGNINRASRGGNERTARSTLRRGEDNTERVASGTKGRQHAVPLIPRMNPQAAAASITANNATAGAMFPPANFALWPLTRVSALVYLALLPIICAIPVVRRCCLRNNKASRWGWPILIGLLFSLWLHFIPCIFWTCDWGPYDGAGVRREEEEPVVWCVVWCVLWCVLWRVLCVLRTP